MLIRHLSFRNVVLIWAAETPKNFIINERVVLISQLLMTQSANGAICWLNFYLVIPIHFPSLSKANVWEMEFLDLRCTVRILKKRIPSFT